MWIEYTGSQPGILSHISGQGFKIFDTSFIFERSHLSQIAQRDFEVLGEVEISPSNTGVQTRRLRDWRNFAAHFQFLKRTQGLMKTDLICLRQDLLTRVL
jgi:hypothetical protein